MRYPAGARSRRPGRGSPVATRLRISDSLRRSGLGPFDAYFGLDGRCEPGSIAYTSRATPVVAVFPVRCTRPGCPYCDGRPRAFARYQVAALEPSDPNPRLDSSPRL